MENEESNEVDAIGISTVEEVFLYSTVLLNCKDCRDESCSSGSSRFEAVVHQPDIYCLNPMLAVT